jgi:hypothetical protein
MGEFLIHRQRFLHYHLLIICQGRGAGCAEWWREGILPIDFMGLGVRLVLQNTPRLGNADRNISLGVMLGVYTAGVSNNSLSQIIQCAKLLTKNRSVALILTQRSRLRIGQPLPSATVLPQHQLIKNSVYRKFPWKKWPGYAVGQVLGAMCAAAVVYGLSLSLLISQNPLTRSRKL